jgi:hypothetical protein
MGIQLQPSLKALQIEREQLGRCRLAFGLFWAGFLIQLLPILFLIDESAITDPATESKPVTRQEVILDQVVFILPSIVLTMTASILNILVGRTPRWRQASWLLLATLLGQVVLAAVGVIALGDSYVPAEGEPLVTRLCFHAVAVALPICWWFIVVIIGEFAMACRETVLLGQTERVSFGVLASIAAIMMYFGWTLNSPVNSDDDVTTFLKAFHSLMQVIVFFWLLFPISRAYMVCTILIRRIDEVGRVVKEGQEPDEGTTK